MTNLGGNLIAGEHSRIVTVGDAKRDYVYYVPQSEVERPLRGWPLVIAFHGSGSNAIQMREFCELNPTADKHGFVVAYANGTGRIPAMRTFNGGICCGLAKKWNVDDVAYTRAMVADLQANLPIDEDRVYATGMSNGAVMCYRLASEAADVIAAIAPVGGTMGAADCAPSRPVPVCHFHGTDDDFVRFDGGVGDRSLSRTNFFSVQYTIDAWVHANDCRTEPVVTHLPQQVDDGTRVIRYDYRDGREGSEVVLYRIEGAGHTWPGHPPRFYFLGTSTKNIDANEAMWDFFSRHRRRMK